MKSDDLRRIFVDFFTRHNHKEIRSASLIPASDDPTVLFTTAGMQPLVPNLLGAPHPKGKRIFDTQKSFRTPDIDEVGDDTHHTFFEMLGNWSLGDYFKEEAIELAYKFFVDKLGLDPKRFAITIFRGDADAPKDEEAKQIWMKYGLEEKQIFEFDKADNFWGPAGSTGPCGPCSEIHYDRGEKYGEDVGPNSDVNQRYVEIWNLVFMEYNKNRSGEYEKLLQKNVDTGVGFERLLAVLNKKDSSFDTDLFTDIMAKISEVSHHHYEDNKRAFRIIADHLRGATFLIADGVLPSNEGRGYVLRRIIRRAIREGKIMNIQDIFTPVIAEAVINKYSKYYPELEERAEAIQQTLAMEEENFMKTLKNGEKFLLELAAHGHRAIDGETAFKLFDTYGFPLDLTKDFAKEHGIQVDEEGYNREMKKQRDRSKESSKKMFTRDRSLQELAKLSASKFVGYDTEEIETKVVEIKKSDAEETLIVLKESPFYGESGGQVGDMGEIIGKNGSAMIIDTQKVGEGVIVHVASGIEGDIEIGDKVIAKIDQTRRKAIAIHHSLAHLFLGACKRVLGEDVHQAGSHVNEKRMRIDITYPRNIKKEDLKKIEKLIAKAVSEGVARTAIEKSLEEAKKEGAEATFGEKYGDTVRTVKMGNFSYELCGGTHVANTSEIGAIKILSESGVSAGVRRIEMIAGLEAQKLLWYNYNFIDEIANLLKVPKHEIESRLEKNQEELKKDKDKIESLQTEIIRQKAAKCADEAEEINGQKIVVISNEDSETLSFFSKSILANGADTAILISASGDFVISTKDESARDLLQKLTTAFGGGGGGNSSFVRGGGMRKVSRDEILEIIK